MKKTLFRVKAVALLFVVVLFVAGCANKNQPAENGMPSIYHWRTVFAPSKTELNFLKQHNIKRLYIKMFDVVAEHNHTNGSIEVVPIATTKFAAEMPNGVEVVPVAYITIDALRAIQGKESEYASLIAERMLAMCSYNNCGAISEMQIDCDWTATTRTSYAMLCQAVKDILEKEGMALSITVRLHQLSETPPLADTGVLMLYNTGVLKDYDTKNSILDINDVRPYIKKGTYPMPLSYAYPAFGWGIKFENQEFVSIVSEKDRPTGEAEYIRKERPMADEILVVKQLVEENLGKPSLGNIIYHLDESQLENYTNDEIDAILAY